MTGAQPDTSMLGRKILLSSDRLPAHLSEKERFDVFVHDVMTPLGGACELVQAEDRPVHSTYEFVAFDNAGFMRAVSNVCRWQRTAQHAASDRRDAFHIGFNTGRSPLRLSQNRREFVQAPNEICFLSTAEPLDVRAQSNMATMCLSISGERLREHVGNADDLLLTAFDPDDKPLRHLRRYMEFLLASGELEGQPQLLAHSETTLIDLAALALGAQGETAALARMRGLRAARLKEILTAIRATYTLPTLAPGDVARRVGISTRYLQDLLHETGQDFSARVLDLRLRHARALLDSARGDGLKIIDIAFASGFSDVTYFNRCFRRRFGLTPTQARRAWSGH